MSLLFAAAVPASAVGDPLTAADPGEDIQFTDPVVYIPDPANDYPTSFRDISIETGFGEFNGTLTWSGPSGGPYHGRVTGEVADLKPNGRCAVVEVSLDGTRYTLVNQRACPYPSSRTIAFDYAKTYVAKVRLCDYDSSDHLLYSCTKWK
ncbi:hypothetical protein [Amycolatopsis sp. NPDC021455]|uniref:hypothetical protein n=1 Tax=Amycolatopsis sp. NPDC021455 TaxID=3154901 RepID=UPI00340F0E86